VTSKFGVIGPRSGCGVGQSLRLTTNLEETIAFLRFRSTVIDSSSSPLQSADDPRKKIFYSTTGVCRITRLKTPRRRRGRDGGERGIPVGTNSERDSRELRERERRERRDEKPRDEGRDEARRAERKAKRSDARRQDRPARVQTQRSLSASSG